MEVSSSVAYTLPLPPFSHVSALIEPEVPDTTDALTGEQQREVAIVYSDRSPVPEPVPIATQEPNSPFWKLFGSTFITIFLAELGDKTQVATLLMAAESHAPWVVFTGAAIALVTTSLLGVLVGQWLSSRISPKTLDTAAGVMLAFISLWLLLDVVKM